MSNPYGCILQMIRTFTLKDYRKLIFACLYSPVCNNTTDSQLVFSADGGQQEHVHHLLKVPTSHSSQV